MDPSLQQGGGPTDESDAGAFTSRDIVRSDRETIALVPSRVLPLGLAAMTWLAFCAVAWAAIFAVVVVL